MKLCQVQDSIDPWTFGSGQNGCCAYDAKRTQAHVDANPKFEVNWIVVYILNIPINDTDGTIKTPLPEVTQPAEIEEFLAWPNTPSPLESQKQESIFSPSVQQVEKNVPDITSTSDKCARLACLEKLQTCNVAQDE